MKRVSEKMEPKRTGAKKQKTSLIFDDGKFDILRAYKVVPHTLVYDIVDNICTGILSVVEQNIEQKEDNKRYKGLMEQVQIMASLLDSMSQPQIEHYASVVNHEIQPKTSKLDRLCIVQNHIEKKYVERKEQSSYLSYQTAITDGFPKNQAKYVINKSKSKNSLLNYARSVMYTSDLVPLASVQSQKDIKLNQIHTFYRQKYNKEDELTKEQLRENKNDIQREMRKTHGNQKQQFAFGYNGEKIPISAGIKMKENTMKVLKTLCKVPKDKCEVKLLIKAQEHCRSSKLGLITNSIKKFQSGSNLKSLKKKVQNDVKWKGKLLSIKNVTETEIQMSMRE